MSNLHKHALMEFKAAGWLDESDNYKDDMQEMICNHVLELLKVFSDEGHSGTSAPYTVNLFQKLAMFEPLVPLTGEDWEWSDVSDRGGRDDGPLFQNKRCGHVFKDANGAYDIDGIVWYDWYTDPETGEKSKSHFTNYQSRVPVTFPYTPTREYREWSEQ